MARRLLLVEDTPTIAELQSVIARRAGYQVDLASSLSAAQTLCQQHDYYCAVVDFLLPDAHQGEAIDFVLEKNIPCIVMTAQFNEDVRNIIQQKPIVDYITKENRQSYHYLEKRLASLPRNEQIKVLLVDSSKGSLDYMCALLKRHHYQVITTNSGTQALQWLNEQENIQVIITDDDLVDMSGNALCASIRERFTPEEKLVIGISNPNNPRLSARFLKNGANDYLHKPFNEEEFFCRVNQNVDMLEQFEKIRRQANLDYLTELANRRYFFHLSNRALKKAKRQDEKVCIAMLDIDHFKRINDSFGHDAGDKVLKTFASLLQAQFGEHHVARIGGEEFAILFNSTAMCANTKALNEFRETLQNTPIHFLDKAIPVTVSSGLICAKVYDLDELLSCADNALYEAKEQGRNRVISLACGCD